MSFLRRAALAGAAMAAGTGVACAAVAVAAGAAKQARVARLRGKVVLITGASRGLGLALAEEFAAKGCRLALTARDADELERAREIVLERSGVLSGDDVLTYACDLTDLEEVKGLVRFVTAHYGQVDVLVNNAGLITVGPVENQTIEDFREVMEANFFSGLHSTLAVLPQMLERSEGSIVNITSIGGKIAVPHLLPYVASKFAAVGLSEGLTAELRSKGIRVTTVCPGLMRTGSHVNARFTGDAEREYRWFSMAASLPGVSASAVSAARKIVSATARGAVEITITPQAALAARLGNLCPAATVQALEYMNRMLPEASADKLGSRRGADVRTREVHAATVLGEAAAHRYNEAT